MSLTLSALWSMARLPLMAVLLLGAFSVSLENLNEGRAAEELRQVETAIRRACVACYADEGSYPQDLDYLKERYGVQIDEESYIVYYEVAGSNLMPDITVLER